MPFLITLGLLVVLVLAVTVWRGAKSSVEGTDPKARARSLDKMISTLSNEVEIGRMSVEDATESKQKLELKLAQALKEAEASTPKSTLGPILSVVVILISLGGASWLYFQSYGSPSLGDLPQADRVDLNLSEEVSAETRAFAQVAGQRLAQDPKSYLANMQIADAFLQSKQYQDAVPYLNASLEAKPKDAAASLALGETLFAINGDAVTDEAYSLFQNVLVDDPNSPPANFYLGLHEIRNGQEDLAKLRYEAMLARSTGQDAWVPAVRAMLAQIDGTTPPVGEGLSGPSAADIADAANMSDDDRQSMIEGMVAGLAERLKDEPDDLQGWVRLARARQVLNDDEGFVAAARQIARLDPDNAQNDQALVRVLVAQNGPKKPLTDEINALFERIQTRNPDDVEALFFSGLKWFQQGDTDLARENWDRVLRLVPEEHPAYLQMKQEIDRLLSGAD